jgi:hypothetical protein
MVFGWVSLGLSLEPLSVIEEKKIAKGFAQPQVITSGIGKSGFSENKEDQREGEQKEKSLAQDKQGLAGEEAT